ncbi:MAG: gfo/Idh/MocA family oxidoreductase [Verrucomicrobia bacterium]|nr:MAG: gfo/Idh/MocA family oxidoreductase [Verrucomicrobiota bacterium]
MGDDIRIGIVGLDTSHVEVFTGLLNDPENSNRVPGGQLVVGYPGGSADFGKSASRVDGYTDLLATKFGVEMVDSPEAVAEASDAILLTSVDGRVHLDQFSRLARFRKPTFIDKPFAVTSGDAAGIAALAREHGTPVMSASGLRFAEALTALLEECPDGISGADFTGPMEIEPTQGAFFWYGVHLVEALYQTLGTGCREVRVTTSDAHDVAVGLWKDGRIGTVRGFRNDQYYFRGVVHTGSGDVFLDLDTCEKPKHVHLLTKVMDFFRSGVSPIPLSETVEAIRFLEAADESRVTGSRVRL